MTLLGEVAGSIGRPARLHLTAGCRLERSRPDARLPWHTAVVREGTGLRRSYTSCLARCPRFLTLLAPPVALRAAQGHGNSTRLGFPFLGRVMKKPEQSDSQPIAPRPDTGPARLELKKPEKGSTQASSPPQYPPLTRADHQLSGDVWQLTRISLEAQEARLHSAWVKRGWVASRSKPSAPPTPPQWTLRTRNVNDLVAWTAGTLESYQGGEQAKFRFLRQVEHFTREAAKLDRAASASQPRARDKPQVAKAEPSTQRGSVKRGLAHDNSPNEPAK